MRTPHAGKPSGDSYVGKRAAGRRATPPTETLAVEAAPVRPTPATPTQAVDPTHHFTDVDVTAELPLAMASAGKRKAVKHAGSRGPLFRGMPSVPVLLGVAVLAVSVGGAVTSAGAGPELADNSQARIFNHASALTGSSGVASVNTLERGQTVSRDSRRDTLEQGADVKLVKAAEAKAEQRNVALGQLAQQAEQQAAKIAENQWVYPTNPVELTATFGEYGLWANYHTGLDFNGEEGDPIMSVANGVVTEAGYDGSYGNKTVVTLDDGTELWYAHQSSFGVSEGDTVSAGQVIGYIGSTGNVTGSHLHLEVRPGGGDPVDPYAAMVVRGLF